jgi:hypothetical protein
MAMTNLSIPAPTGAVGADPRHWIRVSVSDLSIDHRLQRTRDDVAVQRIAISFDWAKFETPTVVAADDSPNTTFVLEGQRRVLALRSIDPDAQVMVCHLGVLPPAMVAEITYAIAVTRKRHTAYDQWNLRVMRGDEHEILAETVLSDRKLHLGLAPASTTIAAVATLKTIIHHYRDPMIGAEHLADVLDVIMGAWPKPDPATPHARFDHVLLGAVSHLLRANRATIDKHRLIDRLRERPAQYWLADLLENRQESRVLMVARHIAHAYNKHLKSNQLGV